MKHNLFSMITAGSSELCKQQFIGQGLLGSILTSSAASA